MMITSSQRFLPLQKKKAGAIVGYKRVLLGAGCGDRLPVFGPAETKIVDVLCDATRRMRQFNCFRTEIETRTV
jgi:hypothetical protein